MFLDPRVFESIQTFDPLAIMDVVLVLATATLGGIARSQSVKLDELRARQRAHEIESGNKLVTIEQATGYDALTGLRGQRWFDSELAMALRGKVPIALIYIDLDCIKQLHAARGHQVADGVIRSAAMAIRAALRRQSDLNQVFRRGDAADEFLVVLEGASLDTGVLLAEQMLTTLRSLSLPVAASIGVADWDGLEPMTAAELERAAEVQMYRAKADGRNRVRARVRYPAGFWGLDLRAMDRERVPRMDAAQAVPMAIQQEHAQRNQLAA